MIFIFGYLFVFFGFTKTLIFPILPDLGLMISIIIIVLLILYLFDFKTSIILIVAASIFSIIMKYTFYYSFLTDNNTMSAIIIIATFVYITLIILSIVRKCDAAENSLEYKSLYELEWFSKYLSLESLQDIIIRNSNDNRSLISYFEIQGKVYKEIAKEIIKNIDAAFEKGSKTSESVPGIFKMKSYSASKNLFYFKEVGNLLMDLIILGPLNLILLFVLAYLNFSIENLSLILGILVFSYIFSPFSAHFNITSC
jgi:hypothetical protein